MFLLENISSCCVSVEYPNIELVLISIFLVDHVEKTHFKSLKFFQLMTKTFQTLNYSFRQIDKVFEDEVKNI